MTDRYILKNGKPVPEPDLYKWGEWFEKPENRIVKQDKKNGIKVSTVFLALDHNFSGVGPPLLWETMVFAPDEEDMKRYSSVKAALKGHAKFVKKYL